MEVHLDIPRCLAIGTFGLQAQASLLSVTHDGGFAVHTVTSNPVR